MKEVGSGEWWVHLSLKWTKLGADRVQGRELGYVNRISGSLVLGSMCFFQYQFLKLKRKKKKKFMTSAIHILHKFYILQINN